MSRDLKSYWRVSSSISTMMNFAAEIVRDLPAPPIFFGLFTFLVLSLFLFLVLRLDRD